MMRPDNLIEKTATALAARLEAQGDGSEDNSRETVLRALNHFLETLEEELLEGWDECLLRGVNIDIPWHFNYALDWARSHCPDAGP